MEPNDTVRSVPTPPDREVYVYSEYEHGPTDYGRRSAAIKRVSWGAIFAGALVALVTGFVLNLLGLGIGLQAFDPASDPDTLSGFGIGQGIWAIISALVSLFAGGWVAGRLAGMPRTIDGVIHGIVVWSVTTMLTLYLLTSGIGSLVSGVTGLIGSGLSAVGQGVAAVAPQAVDYAENELGVSVPDLSTIQAEAEQLLRETGDPALQPGALEADANAAQNAAQNQAESGDLQGAIQTAFGNATGVVNEVDRQDLINVVAARTGQSQEEARQTVAGWESQLGDLRQNVSAGVDSLGNQAVVAAEDATDFLGTSALIGFLALILGAAAAGFGGSVGSPDPLPANAFRRD